MPLTVEFEDRLNNEKYECRYTIFHTFYLEVTLNFSEQIIKSSMHTCTIII
jgi:hypothetical protein